MVEICYAKQIKADIEFYFLWNGSCNKDCGSIIIDEMYYERVNAGEKHKVVTSFGIKEIKKNLRLFNTKINAEEPAARSYKRSNQSTCR
jgi:hypothetical protein